MILTKVELRLICDGLLDVVNLQKDDKAHNKLHPNGCDKCEEFRVLSKKIFDYLDT